MATKTNAIVKVGDEEIKLPERPSIDTSLASIPEVLKELYDLKTELQTLDKEAREIVIDTAAKFQRASQINARRREIATLCEQKTKPIKKPFQDTTKLVQEHQNRATNLAGQVAGIIEAKMNVWSVAENNRAEAEKRRLQAQLDKQQAELAEQKKREALAAAAETKKKAIADLKALYRNGKGEIKKAEYVRKMRELDAAEEVAAEQAELDREATAAAAPKIEVEGVKKGRTWYNANCADKKTFIEIAFKRFLAGDEAMWRFITVDDDALDAEANVIKDSAKMMVLYPGVEAKDHTTF